MKIANLLLVATALAGEAAETIREAVLDPKRVVRVAVSRERLTTVHFPSAISDLEGTYLSAEDERPALFQISFRPGQSFFSLRALATNVSTTLTVGWRGKSCVLELLESPEPVLVLNFILPPVPLPQVVNRSPHPARLRALLQTARLYSEVQFQQPELLRDVHCFLVNSRQAERDYEATMAQVFHFAADDTLVFQVRFVNRMAERIAYLPSSLGVRVGDRAFAHALAEADGVIPPCGEATIWFAVSGGVNGVPPGLSPRNSFQVVLERLGPPSRKRCPKPPAALRTVTPARSPKHESLHR
jgi:hypothetical protein